MRTGLRVAVCGLLILSASAVQAADSGFYFGASAGQAQYDFDEPAGFVPVLRFPTPIVVISPNPIFTPAPPVIGGVTTVAIEARPVLWMPGEDDEATAWSVTAGYRINRYLALEAGYVNLGTLSHTQSIEFLPAFGVAPLSIHREIETAGPTLTVFGTLPLSTNWQLYARAGVLFADTDLTTTIGGNSVFSSNSASSSFDSDATTLGAGAQYDWGGHWSARLEFQRTADLGDDDDVAGGADVDSFSLGFLYRL